MWGSKDTTPGGKGQEFLASVELKFWTSHIEKRELGKELIKDFRTEEAESIKINFKANKNKTYTPKITGSYRMDLSDGHVMDEKLVLSMCEKNGMLENTKNGWKLGDKEFKLKKEAIDFMNEPEIFEQTKDYLLKIMLKRKK